MGKAGFLLNGVALTGVLTMLLIGSEGRPTAVVQAADDELTAMENVAAREPTAASIGALASEYLDRREPGLAQALLDRHPQLDGAELAFARSRTALGRGDLAEAERLTELTLAICDVSATACTAKLFGRTLHQASYLRALSDAGIADPAINPEAAAALVERSGRLVRLASR
jgi:hypothetical protein